MTETQRDWKAFALLIIDLQEDFWSERLAQSFPQFPAKITQLLELCRSEDIEVVHLRASFRPDMSDWMPMYKLRQRIPCVQGTAGVETLPFALEQASERVIVKQSFDGFHSPELLRYLQQQGKRFLLTAGLVTSVCVLFTTVSAAQHGFLTAVVEDCCADQPQAHEETLNRYQFIFERTTVDTILEQRAWWLDQLKELDRTESPRGKSRGFSRQNLGQKTTGGR